jgi:hypothetical protein
MNNVNLKINKFMDYIYMKPKFSKTNGIWIGIVNYLKAILQELNYKKFMKQLKQIAPDFDLLWDFANFIKLLEVVFFYDNNSTTGRYYSSTSYKDNENGFIINLHEQHLTLKFKLDRNDHDKITLEVDRRFGHKIKTTFIIINRETNFDSIHDINLIYNINEILCREMPALLDIYYKKA